MSPYWYLVYNHHINDMSGHTIRLYINDNLFATFRRMCAELWFRQHKAIVWDIKDVLSVNDDGTYIDVYCSRFE